MPDSSPSSPSLKSGTARRPLSLLLKLTPVAALLMTATAALAQEPAPPAPADTTVPAPAPSAEGTP
ncbi:MAG: hypothetical protein EOP86_10080, partial [Verrucomicrobiaceae bacterium]